VIYELGLGHSFLLPAVVFLFIFIFISIIFALYMSFFDWSLMDLGRERIFTGLSHYAALFSDEVFLTALKNTLTLVAVCLAGQMFLGYFIALALWTLKRNLRVLQTIIILPMIMSPVIVGLIWRFIYDPQFGMMNFILRNTLGVGNLAWLGDPALSLPSIMIVDIWQMNPFVVLVLFTGMTAISDEWIEAAMVDGATYWQIVRLIVTPSIIPLINFTILIRAMDLFKIFDTVFLLTAGGPGTSTETIALYTYKTGFRYMNMGYSMAISIFTLFFILAFSIIYILSTRVGNKE